MEIAKLLLFPPEPLEGDKLRSSSWPFAGSRQRWCDRPVQAKCDPRGDQIKRNESSAAKRHFSLFASFGRAPHIFCVTSRKHFPDSAPWIILHLSFLFSRCQDKSWLWSFLLRVVQKQNKNRKKICVTLEQHCMLWKAMYSGEAALISLLVQLF